MGYFRYTKSEEDLKEQYRALLIKYNYKDERNKYVIDAITSEYQQMVQQARYDNGYRTFGQKIKEKFTDAYNEYKREQEIEANRKRALASRIWTKDDFQNIIDEIKAFLRRVIPIQIQSNNETVIKNIKIAIYGSKRSKEIYDACIVFIGCVSQEDAETIKRLKEKLEYCVSYLVGGDESKEEKVLRQIEDQLGKYACEICLKYLPKDVDPIEDLEIRNDAKIWGGREEEREKDLKLGVAAICFLMGLPGVGIILLWLAFAIDMLSTDTDAFLDIGNYVPLFWAGVLLWIVSLVWKGNVSRIERRKRIIGKEKNIQAKNRGAIARLILRLFGL